ncbi:MAG: hypothetical protein AB8G26_06235 [Ilumatobacter sp.]
MKPAQLGGAALVLALAVGACTGGSDSEAEPQPDISSTTPDTLGEFDAVDEVRTLDCSTDALAEVPDWPFDLVGLFRPVTAVVDDLEYRATGVTSDAEALLVTALDDTFADFEASEPTGGANDIAVEFTDASAADTLKMADEDGDGCWAVAVVGLHSDQPRTDVQEAPEPAVEPGDVDEPDDGEVVPGADGDPLAEDPTGPDGGIGAPVEPDDPLDSVGSQGRAEVIAARGTFSVGITQCEVAPVAIEGLSSEGTLTISGVAPDGVAASFVYPDGIEISDPEARVLALTAAGGTIIFEGQNPDGPETIIVNLACDVPE